MRPPGRCGTPPQWHTIRPAVTIGRMKGQRFWSRDWFAGLILTLGFFLAAGSAPVTWLDGKAYDLVASLSSDPPREPPVAVVGIGEEDLAELGPWPWPRDYLAELLESLDGARAIGLALPLHEPQYPHAVQRLDELLAESGEDSNGELFLRLREKLATDERLASTLATTGALVGAPATPRNTGFEPGLSRLDLHQRSLHDIARPENAEAILHSLPSTLAARPPSVRVAQPHAGLTGAAPVYPLVVPEQARAMPLAATRGDTTQPTLVAALIAASNGTDPERLEFTRGWPVVAGDLSIPADWGARFYPRYQAEVPVYSFREVMEDAELRASLADHTVLVGTTAAELSGEVRLPDGSTLPPVEAAARAVASALAEHHFQVPGWAVLGQFAVLAAAGLFVMFALPRFRYATGFLLTVLLGFLLFNAHFVLLGTYATWVPMMAAGGLLASGFVVIGLKHAVRDRLQALHQEISSANRQLGRALHVQGQLDAAFEKYRNCMVDEGLLEQLYGIGLDYERKRQYNRAAAVFSYLENCRPGFRDATQRAQRNTEMEERVVLGNGGKSNPTGTVITGSDGLQKPMLGRYEIEKEIGRGSMGMVYLGSDPKIGRTVAIKTLALTQEFDNEALAEVRERFFREAETAGRLDHPNVVTVYDVGEDQDLAYIAMDYLKGEPLSEFCRPDRLLPPAEALEVAAQVADALDYAHKQNVVHRDVKPANIVYHRELGVVKVTDFGVACLTDSTRTKTGTVLGSPSYMSPEQFAGVKVDGRSDLFALGVTLYQLLTGTLPFSGDSFATLMYRITHEKHPEIRRENAELPPCVTRIINKTLQKAPEARYQSGANLAESLRRCARG